LPGLTAFTATAHQRDPIRKVLGASVAGIANLLSREFITLVVTAFAVAAPLAWFGGNKWLNEYAYRIDLSWKIFAITGGLSVLAAFLTVFKPSAQRC